MPRYRIIQVITPNYINALESSPFILERSFDKGQTWSALAAYRSWDEAIQTKNEYERSWDGENSYVG